MVLAGGATLYCPPEDERNPMTTKDAKEAALLALPAEKKLLKKIAKVQDADALRALLAKAAPGADPLALLADLARRGQLPREEAVIELLQQTAAELEPSAIRGFFEGLDNGDPSPSWHVPGFEEDELPILARSVARHADAWATIAQDATLSPLLQSALALVQARAGRPVDAAVAERLVDELAAAPLALGRRALRRRARPPREATADRLGLL